MPIAKMQTHTCGEKIVKLVSLAFAIRAILCFGLVSALFVTKAAQAQHLLVDVENLQITEIEKKAVALMRLTKVEEASGTIKLLQVKEQVLSYLRCETPISLDQFGEPDKQVLFGALESLARLNKDLPFENLSTTSEVFALLPLRAWRGLAGQLHADSSYGFLSVLQYYTTDQKSALLREIELAGWKDFGVRNVVTDNPLYAKSTFRIFKKPDQPEPVTRELHVFEVQAFVDSKIAPRPGLTVACLSKAKK